MTTAIRVYAVFALITVASFFAAGATSGGTLPVAIGFLGLFAAITTFAVAIDATPAPRPADHRRRHEPTRTNRRSPLASWETRS